MEGFSLLLDGLATLMQPQYLLFAVIGCVLGTMVGVLPGVGPASGTAVLIPLTLSVEPTQAIIMLAAIYYGAMYGGTITSVLLNLPGEAASAITCIEGYAMARKGRAGAALTISAIGSWIAMTFATVLLVVVAVPLSNVALKFGPTELFALMLVGLALVTGLAGASLTRAFISGGVGLVIAMVGIDPVAGVQRMTFGVPELLDGVPFIPMVMGLFAIAEILEDVEQPARSMVAGKMKLFMLSKQEAKDSAWPIARGTGIGAGIGLIPGVGSIVPAVIAYIVEKRWSKNKAKFGTGAIEGVASPEAANNSYAVSAMIPFFSLGIPSSPTIAIIAGAFLMHGLVPGPTLFTENPDLTWTIIASLFVGNLILLILNLPFIPVWVQILRIPRPFLFGGIVVFTVIGSFSIRNSVFDVGVMFAFGIVGYLFRKADIPSAPLLLTVILGPMMEQNLRRALQISDGSYSIFFTRPIALTLLVIAVMVTVVFSFGARRNSTVATVLANE